MGAFEQAWRLLKTNPQDRVRDYPQGDDRTMHPSVKEYAERSLGDRLEGLPLEDYPRDHRAYDKERSKLVQPQTPPSPFPVYDESGVMHELGQKVPKGGLQAKSKTVQGPDGNFYQVYDDEGYFIPPE